MLATGNLQVRSCVFKLNSAFMSGGAIQFMTQLPPIEIIELNKFIENTAIYGKNYASFPIRLKLMNTTSFIRKNGLLSLYLFPGVKLDLTFQFTLFDHFGQPVLLNYSEYG